MEEEIGVVENYFSHVGVVAIKLTKELKKGSTVRILGHTTDMTVTVESMQIERNPVEVAPAGASVGIKVPSKARKGDRVYLIT